MPLTTWGLYYEAGFLGIEINSDLTQSFQSNKAGFTSYWGKSGHDENGGSSIVLASDGGGGGPRSRWQLMMDPCGGTGQ